MNKLAISRRELIVAVASVSLGGVALSGCEKEDGDENEVTANEDLMREHGIIRRSLFVYVEAARRARTDPASIPLTSLADTAKLFREFAEDYHERGLEEAHIFRLVRKLQSPVAGLPDVLLAQHQRGREITDYVQRIAGTGTVPSSEAERLAATLESFVAMYGPHTAREDTVLFPAWKAALGRKGYEEMGEEFEELEHKMFGHDGFEAALARIAKIEQAMGLSDLAAVTAAPPTAA